MSKKPTKALTDLVTQRVVEEFEKALIKDLYSEPEYTYKGKDVLYSLINGDSDK